jgi:DNA-binding NarL/FixJ family response regulator
MPIVLIVDDYAPIRAAIRHLFESHFECVACGEAENGVEAILQVEKLHPDLIVVDLCMPIMNGIEAAKILREVSPHIPIFLLTAHYLEATVQAALQAGIRGVFSKQEDLGGLLAQADVVFGASCQR